MRWSSPLRSQWDAWLQQRGPASDAPDSSDEGDRPGAAIGMRQGLPELVLIPWGPADAEGEAICEVPGDFGEFELEYAALRRAAGLIDLPNRAVLRVTGSDRLDFLGRMLTQDVRGLKAGHAAPAFLLSRKGRIEGDLYLIELGEETLIDLDVHQLDSVTDALSRFVIADDVQLTKLESQVHRMALHGRRAEALLAAAVTGAMPDVSDGRCARIVLGGAETVIFRRDMIDEPGYEFIVPRDAAGQVWEHLLSVSVPVGDRVRRARPVGWFAFNVARIEAGAPIFNIDFGTTSLPHESGVLHSRVSFRKGCYLGQEIVARMEALGKPKQMLVALDLAGEDESERDDASLPPLPVCGAPLMPGAQEGPAAGDPVGMVTSSALSPLAGGRPVMIAVVRTAEAQPGRALVTYAEGKPVRCVVRPLGQRS